MANLGDISKINLPNGNVVNIKDATARAQANWNTNNGVKNLLDVTYDTYTNNECSYVKNADGSITLTISSTVAAQRQLNLTNKIDNIYDGMIINGSPTGYSTGNIEYLITGLKADGTYQNEQFSYNGAESTINRGTPKIQFSILVKSGVTARTVTFYPMVREVGDSTYQPYALPNTKITPELIELVDSGAKNLCNNTLATGTISSNVTATVSTDKQVTLSGTTPSNADASFTISTNTQFPAGTYIGSGCPSGGATDKYRIDYVVNDSTVYRDTGSGVEFTLDSASNVRSQIVIYRGNAAPSTAFKPMLCSKAAWDVSQKFVPYRPTYEETVEQVAKITPTTTYKTNHAFQSASYELINDIYVDVPDGKRIFLVVGAKQSNVTGVAVCFNTRTYDATKIVISQEVSAAQQMISCAGCYDNGNGGRSYRLYVFAKGVAGSQLNCRVTLSWWYL